MLDFKKKTQYEEKVLKIISKTKIGKKLADLWHSVKHKNQDIITEDKDKKIRNIYKDIHKDIKKELPDKSKYDLKDNKAEKDKIKKYKNQN
jgi:hypothetical protein